ncbi:MAG: DUF488 family protein [Pseudonocardiaceae bacterium]|nr:DUF488 family protein [Pseudonocardiaceae bacterium]
MQVQIKRAREGAARSDGYRVLVDRMWPRGVSKDTARLDEWARELAPSDELRRWYGHDPDRFDEFKRRYVDELRGQRDTLSGLRRRARQGQLTLVVGARDVEHSNGQVLADVLRRGLPR